MKKLLRKQIPPFPIGKLIWSPNTCLVGGPEYQRIGRDFFFSEKEFPFVIGLSDLLKGWFCGSHK